MFEGTIGRAMRLASERMTEAEIQRGDFDRHAASHRASWHGGESCPDSCESTYNVPEWVRRARANALPLRDETNLRGYVL